MLVTVEFLVKKIMDDYGFNQIMADHDLTKAEIVQILYDHGYIDLSTYEESDE